MKFRASTDVPCAGQPYAASEMKRAIDHLAQGVVTVSLAIAVFFAITLSVELLLETTSHPSAIQGVVAMPHPTPDPGTSSP